MLLRLQGVRHGPVVYRPYKRGTPVSPPLLLLLLLLPLLAVAAHIATLPSVAAFPSAAALSLHFPGPRINNLYCMRPRRRNCWAKFGCSRTRCVCSGHSSWRRHRGIWSSIFDWCSWVGPNNILDPCRHNCSCHHSVCMSHYACKGDRRSQLERRCSWGRPNHPCMRICGRHHSVSTSHYSGKGRLASSRHSSTRSHTHSGSCHHLPCTSRRSYMVEHRSRCLRNSSHFASLDCRCTCSCQMP